MAEGALLEANWRRRAGGASVSENDDITAMGGNLAAIGADRFAAWRGAAT